MIALLAQDPFSIVADSGRGMLILIGLVAAAVLAVWFGGRRFSRQRGTHALRPVGRVLREFRRPRLEQWRAVVAKLERRDPTPIADCTDGPVRIEGVLTRAAGSLGGAPGLECIWRNRAGARPDCAVACEVVIIADDSGHCGIEALEGAYVIAPHERLTHHHESISLYLGDRVEVFGHFERDKVDDPKDPSQTVYGTLGASGGLDLRLVHRPPRPEPTAPKNSAHKDSP